MPHIHFNPIRLGLALVAMLAVAAPATAQASTQHHYKSVIQSATLSTANGYPGIGSTAVFAGSWNTDLFGRGAVVDHTKITGNPTPSSVQPDGSQKLSVTGRYVGGTGPYKGAKGSYKFKGTTAPGGSVVTGRSSGTIKY